MTKLKNTGLDNTGENNNGNWNSGNRNSGNWNSGNRNSGNWNSGDWNNGNRNSGDRNSGYRNSGNWNSGYGNSGDWNNGYGNSGNWNSGDWNSGYGNSGYGNSGYGNSTNRSSGIFCTQEPVVILFDKPTNLKWDEIDHPHFDEFYLCKWISEGKMTEDEKKANPQFSVCDGYLKTFTYKEAWANFWRDTDQENREKFLKLPNFDPVIFEEITGIKVGEPSLAGKIVDVTVDGKKYKAIIQESK